MKKDLVSAVAWFRKAAEQGHVHAQLNLGVRCLAAKGVERDEAAAAAWFKEAAEQGHTKAVGALVQVMPPL